MNHVIRVRTGAGSTGVGANVAGHWAWHRTLGGAWGWTVSHVATGYAIMKSLVLEAEARYLATELEREVGAYDDIHDRALQEKAVAVVARVVEELITASPGSAARTAMTKYIVPLEDMTDDEILQMAQELRRIGADHILHAAELRKYRRAKFGDGPDDDDGPDA